MKKSLVLALMLGSAVSLPASAATLVGEQATITESIGATYVAYGYYAGPSSQSFNTTIGSAFEVPGGGGPTLGKPGLPTQLDIDPVTQHINIYFNDYWYGALVALANWKVDIAISPSASVIFTNLYHINHNSTYATPSGTFTSNTLSFDFSGGYLNRVSQYGQTFFAIYGYETAANPGVGGIGVPEPATWAMMVAGFALAGASIRRRTKIASR